MNASDRRFLFVFPLICLSVLASPLVWRATGSFWQTDARPPSYLPALEPFRDRLPFDPAPIEALRNLNPYLVAIGDSMADRLHFGRLETLTGRPSTTVNENSTGSAYWYLTFKNYVVASGTRPDWVVVFFRDALLTDPTFRLTGSYRRKVDLVARDREDELNAALAARSEGAWHRVHRTVDDFYGVPRAREWIEPRLTAWPARVVIGTARKQALLDEVNEAFALDRLRAFEQADVEAAAERELDFDANLDTSVLPAFISLARAQQIRLCFVRVLRRPVNGRPPPESRALSEYVRKLADYLKREGVAFIDDRDDPVMASLLYGDGDHVAAEAREPYTDLFWRKLQAFE